MMETRVKMTKQLYKAWDSYNRYQIWIGKNLLKALLEERKKQKWLKSPILPLPNPPQE